MNLPDNTLLQGGKYRIIRFISSGGFGCTYEAELVLLHKRIAIKEFFVKDFCNRDENTSHVTVATQSKMKLIERLKRKFIEEASALFSMQHPHIVRVTDVFEENDTAYYVMEYINGQSLQNIVKEKGGLDEDLAVYYICQIADALKYVHSLSRLHLDIKPGNIMINKNNQAILIDFGASKQYDEVEGENTSTLLGKTPSYAPIEQISNNVKNFTPATDIYALGATLYKLLTGITPPDATEIFNEGLKDLPDSVSDNIRTVVNKSMELRVKDRPQSINDFILLLNIKSNTTTPIIDRNVESMEAKGLPSQTDIKEDTLIYNESAYLDVDLGLSVNWCNNNIEKNSVIYWGWSDLSGKKKDTDLSLYPHNNPPQNICSSEQYDIATDYLGKGWRLPTKDEIDELQNKCKWIWTSIEGEHGYKVIGKNGNSIFLPAIGFRTGNFYNGKGIIGYYWSGELSKNKEEAYTIFFNQDGVKTWSVRRYFGLAIRAVKDYNRIDMQTSKNELKLGVLYQVESPISFYHVHHNENVEECYMQEQINTILYSRNHTSDGHKPEQEKLFESIREANFPLFPSRKKCLFLSKTKEDAKYWHNYFRKRCNYTKCYKVTLLSGKFVLLDLALYDEGEFQKYWKGEQISDDIEILFEGECRTEEIETNWD